MDLLQRELGSCNETRVTYTLNGKEVTSMEAERVSYITEEEDQEPVTIPAIKTEPYVSCVPVESVTDIYYRLYLQLPGPISVCLCETRI
jgi:hypothetical protein